MRARASRPRLFLVAGLVVAVLAIVTAGVSFRVYLLEAEARRITAVRFPGGEVAVEVAVSAAERQAGLAGREGLRPDSGMLFAYRDTGPRRFTMAGMRFPLDIISISGGGEVTGVQTRRPGDGAFDTPSARYVLEVAAGWAASHGVIPGLPSVLIYRNAEGGSP